jgi:hypothetical protein
MACFVIGGVTIDGYQKNLRLIHTWKLFTLIILKLVFAGWKSSSSNLIFQTWFFKNQLQMARFCSSKEFRSLIKIVAFFTFSDVGLLWRNFQWFHNWFHQGAHYYESTTIIFLSFEIYNFIMLTDFTEFRIYWIMSYDFWYWLTTL